MYKHLGKQSIIFNTNISIKSTASVVGPKEGEGPLRQYYDVILPDVLAGGKSWEQAESLIVNQTFELAIQKSGISKEEIDFVIAGDLLNQSTGTTFGIRDINLPFLGVFSACSTMGEAMAVGSMVLDGSFAKNVVIGASSHFCGAEKQFRTPLNLGSQRPPTATWTVTGCGSAVLSSGGNGPFVKGATIGKIIDMGIKDPFNMGAAMAPAAVDTLLSHFKDFNRTPDYYDEIFTGDLGYVGHELVVTLMEREGYDMSKNYSDCGIKIFDRESQDTHSGGSGCACAAVTFAGNIMHKFKAGVYKKILFIPTGALLSTTTTQQGESIPSIAHAIIIESE